MIKFFRRIRYDLMEKNKTGKPASRTGRYLKYAIGEIVLVVIGILIALSINNWNENRKQNIKEKYILERLLIDLDSDMDLVSYQIEKANLFNEQMMFCIDVILDKRETTVNEFVKNLSPLLTILSFDQNRTTFDNIISTGQIEFLRNQSLTDSIVDYYNDGSNIGWDSGVREYSRNIIAPYLMRFDHIPPKPQTSYREKASQEFTNIDISTSQIDQKSIDDYKNDIFILNALRQKIYMHEGQTMEYIIFKKSIERLQKQILNELE